MGGNVFPPQYGIGLTNDELNSNIPISVLYGISPSNEFFPIKIDATGALAIEGTISVGTVTIEGEDPVDSSTHPLAIVNFGPDGYALRTAIFDEGNQLKVNADGSINVDASLSLTNVGILNTSDVQINPATEGTLSAIKVDTDKFNFLSNRLLVDGSQVTQPVSGTVVEPFAIRSDVYTTSGTGVIVNVSTTPLKTYSLEVKGTGASATSWTVVIEGSLNGFDFTPIMTHTDSIGDGIIIFSGASLFPSLYIRSNCNALSLGSATNIVVTILGVE